MLSRSRKAFTLLELIVVIVILGLLAALAIPTFQEVIKKSEIRTAKSSGEAVGRNAVAIAAISDGGLVTEEAFETSVEETNGKVTVADGAFTAATETTPATAVVTTKGQTVTITFEGRNVTAAVAGE